MTPHEFHAQAAAADREADAIFDAIDAANAGSELLRPVGFEAELERASHLRRRARALRAEAEESLVTPAARAPAPNPARPVETVDSVARRILESDSIVAGPVAPLLPVPPAAMEANIEAVAQRILNS